MDDYCVRGGDQAAADQFGRLLRDDPTEGQEAKVRCDYWLGMSLRLKSDVKLMAFIDQVRERACVEDTNVRLAETRDAEIGEQATREGLKEWQAGACTAEHQKALEAMRDAAAKGMQLKLWNEGEDKAFRVHASSYVLSDSLIAVVDAEHPATVALSSKAGPELHAFVYGAAPVAVRFEGGGAASEKSRWDGVALRHDWRDGNGWRSESQLEWYSPSYGASAGGRARHRRGQRLHLGGDLRRRAEQVTRPFGSALLLACVVAVVGCAPAASARKPGFGDWVLPKATLVAKPILCPGTMRDGNGTPLFDAKVVERADMGEMARSTLVEYLTRGFVRPSFQLFDECDEMSSMRAVDVAEWARPLPPKGYKQAMAAAQADALLVTFITTEEVCHALGEGQQGVRCAESTMLLGAYLFTAEGDVVWKSWTRHPLGDGFPIPSLEEPRRLFLSYPTQTLHE